MAARVKGTVSSLESESSGLMVAVRVMLPSPPAGRVRVAGAVIRGPATAPRPPAALSRRPLGGGGKPRQEQEETLKWVW